jgi:hypothetical protein
VWFRGALKPGEPRNKGLIRLIHAAGRRPEWEVCPNDMALDDDTQVTLRFDDETAAILDAAAEQMCLTQTDYIKHLMRHAGLTVTVALNAEQMERLRHISDGNPEQYVRDLIIDKIRDT